MATVSGKQFSVGARHTRIFELNTAGYPANSGSTVYQGYQLTSVESFDFEVPQPRIIDHVGDDRMQQKDVLPPTTGMKATITAARNDQNIYAILTGTKQFTVNEHTQVGLNTSQQGANPQIGIISMQQSLDETGTRTWRTIVVPKAVVFPLPGKLSQEATKHQFAVTPQITSKHLWGSTFTAASDGFTTAEAIELQNTTQPWVAGWVPAVSGSSFVFDTNYPASGSSKVTAYVNGTVVAASAMTGTSASSLMVSSGVSASANLIVIYELGVSV